MQVDWKTDPRTGDLVFSGTITGRALLDLKLDRFDRRVVAEPIEKASDLFQTLEILFRRSEQMAGRE